MHDDRAVASQLLATARQVISGPTGIGITVSLLIVIAAGVVAPGDAPGGGAWLRVLATWFLAAGALGAIASVGASRRAAGSMSPVIVWSALLLAVLINLSFGALATALAVLGLILLLLTVPGSGHPLTFWIVAVTVTPLWVWSAFGTWDRWLLMLVPIAAIGLVSLEHAVRAGHSGGSLPETMAAWVGLLGLAALTVAVALLGSIDLSWATAAALAVAILAAIDLAMTQLPSAPLSPVLLPAIALAALVLGWLATL